MQSPFDQRGIHLLIDPDKWTDGSLRELISQAGPPVRSVVVGGSYIHSGRMTETVGMCCSGRLPVGTFVGAGPIDCLLDQRAKFAIVPILIGARSTQFITDHLISIVEVAARLKVQLYCVGYIPLDGGSRTSCEFVTQEHPVPRGRPGLVALTARVAASLGLQGLYLDAGSGATAPVTPEEVSAARAVFPRTLMVGGGLTDSGTCKSLFSAGADALFIGTYLERSGNLRSILERLTEAEI